VDELLKRDVDVTIVEVLSSGRLGYISNALSNRRCKSLVGQKLQSIYSLEEGLKLLTDDHNKVDSNIEN
jgi:hypothetical protein